MKLPSYKSAALYFLALPLLLAGSGSARPQSHDATALAGFSTSPFFNEQVVTFRLNPDIRIHINAPAAGDFDASRPVGLALFALPNGNTIEQTVGKVLSAGDDWHFDIQHIGAQTRFLRERVKDYNLVTVYLENTQKSWPTWNSQTPGSAAAVRKVVEYLKSCFRDYHPFVILTGHSGGGRFIFSFMDGSAEIPDYVQRICFLDSDYGYEHSYGDKMIKWLKGSSNRYLSVIAYNDSVALYNGQPVVSPTGGTWYRSRMMQRYLAASFPFASSEDDQFISHSALDGRIRILLKKNPEQKILHTVQVELNGFIHTMLTGTDGESAGYAYYGDRAYSPLVQDGELAAADFQLPLRSQAALSGSLFMESLIGKSFAEREEAILNELLTGNVPYFLRALKELQVTFQAADGQPHLLTYRVMPDYLAIGSDSDYCRVPMGPLTAQKAADFFGACLPTRKLVDHIYKSSEVKLEPVTYAPVGNQNEQVAKFVLHNQAIENQLQAAGAKPGQLIGGTKKDVILSNKIIDPARPGHVVIYGWHQLNGAPIQPLTNIHYDYYVDYSHGIRLLAADIKVDNLAKKATDVLKDPALYMLLSDESGPMTQPTYITDSRIPSQPRSFGVTTQDGGNLKLVIKPDPAVDNYQIYTSGDGLQFSTPGACKQGFSPVSTAFLSITVPMEPLTWRMPMR